MHCQRILRKALVSSPKARAAWEDISPLSRNEWICWVISAKKEETKSHRIEVALSKLNDGMRRPCCWAGCPHRSGNPQRRNFSRGVEDATLS
jgi:hypothetical protein